MTDTTTEGWTPWNGGECPVPHGTNLQVKYRNGQFCFGVAPGWSWEHSTEWWPQFDIISFRIISPKPTPAVPDPVVAAVERLIKAAHDEAMMRGRNLIEGESDGIAELTAAKSALFDAVDAAIRARSQGGQK